MSGYVVTAYMSGVDGVPADELAPLRVVQPDFQITLNTRAEIAEWIDGLVQLNENMFEPFNGQDIFTGSGSTLMFNNQVEFTSFLHAMHQVEGGTGAQIMAHIAMRFGIEMFSNVPGQGLFYVRRSSLRLQMNYRRMGVRDQNLRFSDITQGMVQQFQNLLDTKSPPENIGTIRIGQYDLSTGAEIVTVVKRMTCVYLSLFLRFHQGIFWDWVRKEMRITLRQSRLPAKLAFLQRTNNTFIEQVILTVCEVREIDPTHTVLYTPTTDVELAAICHKFEFGAVVITVGDFQKFAENVVENRARLAGITDANTVAEWRMQSQHVSCVMGVNMDAFQGSHSRHRVGGIVLVGSNFQGNEAHVDPVLDPHIEGAFLNLRYTHLIPNLIYEPGLRLGYRDKVIQLKNKPMEPIYVYDSVKPVDFQYCIGNTKRTGLEIDCEEAFESFVALLVMFVEDYEKCGDDAESKRQVISNMPSHVYFSTMYINQVHASMEPRKNPDWGLIFMYQQVYKELERYGAHYFYDMSQFRSSVSVTRQRNLFTKHMCRSEYVHNGRFEMVTKFDNISSFTIAIKANGYPLIRHIGIMETGKLALANNLLLQHPTYKMELQRIARESLQDQGIGAPTETNMQEWFDNHFARELAMHRLANSNPFLDLLLRSKPIQELFTKIFATAMPLQIELVDLYDPCFDEPPISESHLGRKPQRLVEADCCSYYLSVLLGHWDSFLETDAYNNTWVFGAYRRGSITNFEPNDVMMSYEIDFGICLVKNVNLDELRRYWPHDKIPWNPNIVWTKFSSDYPAEKRLTRYIHNGAIIHFSKWVNQNCLYNDSLENTFRWVQHSVFNIQKVAFNASPSERRVLHTAMKFGRGTYKSKMCLETHFNGLFHGLKTVYRGTTNNTTMKSIKPFRDAIRKVVQDIVDICPEENVIHTTKRRFLKTFINASIGRMKHAYTGGVKITRVADTSTGSTEQGVLQTQINDTPIHIAEMTQLHVRELPEIQKLLTELVSIKAVSVTGSARCFRQDLLTRAFCIMDILAITHHAYRTKTDALFIPAENLPGLIQDIKDHKVPGANLLDNPPDDYNNFTPKEMPPIKWEEREDNDERDVIAAELGNPDSIPPPRQLRANQTISEDSCDILENLNMAPRVQVANVSDLLLKTVQDLVPNNNFTDGVVVHYQLMNDPLRDQINDLLYHKMFEYLDNNRSVLIEGPPGTGKSTFLRRYMQDIKSTVGRIYVTTATHSTIQPYLHLADETIKVGTFHSFIGTFRKILQVSANPVEYWKSKEGKARAKFLHHRPGTHLRDVLIVDEYEILPYEAEEILLALSRNYNMEIILVGDRHQTACLSRGIRFDSPTLMHITQGACMHFDLQYRNTDYQFYVNHQQAIAQPLKYLEMCNYIVSDVIADVYNSIIADVAKSWMVSGYQQQPMQHMTSSPDYKRATCVAIDVLQHLYDDHEEMFYGVPWVFHTGYKAFVNNDINNALGEYLEDELPESISNDGHGLYINNCNYRNTQLSNGPSGKSFMVGTMVYLLPGFEYICIAKITTQYKYRTNDDTYVSKTLRQGERVRFVKQLRSHYTLKKSKTKHHISIFLFRAGNEEYHLTEFEVRARIFYPFGLYQGAIVGHTYEKYTMFNTHTVNEANSKFGHYATVKARIQGAQETFGPDAWMSSHVKQLNVAVTRVHDSRNVCILDLREQNKWYWKNTFQACTFGHYCKFQHSDAQTKDILLNASKSVRREQVRLSVSRRTTLPSSQAYRCPLEELIER